MPKPWIEYGEQDDEFLRQNYKKRGAKWCAENLNGRTANSIHCRARKIGLSKTKEELTRRSNDLIDAVIRRYYTGERKVGFVKNCARQVGREVSWVSARAAELGLLQSRDVRPWTDEELDFVSAHPLLPLRGLARRMAKRGWKRTPSAIAYIPRGGRVETSDDRQFTAAGLAETMGVTTTTVVGWIKRDLLKASRRGWDRSETQHGDGYVIHERDVAIFVLRYPAHVSLTKLEPNKFWFIDLLARYARTSSTTGRQDSSRKSAA